jgi:hypothetical protein
MKTDDDKKRKADLEEALRQLLIGDQRVKVDPATGQIVPGDGEKSSLTDPEDPNTIR